MNNILENYILEVKNLSKIYKGNKGIKEVSFKLKENTVLGIIGLNGAGKSTLISTLTGFCGHTGDITYNFDGKIYTKPDHNVKNNLGIVYSDYGYPSHFTAIIVDRIMKRTYDNWDSNCFFEIIDLLELEKKLVVKKYSTGMHTKLAIAIAMSHGAKLLVLDEATRGLDIKATSRVRSLLHNHMSQTGNSIILTSHIIGEIEKLSDEIMLIEQGQVKFVENKDNLIHQNQIFNLTNEQLDSIDKTYIKKIQKTSQNISLIANDVKSFASKYNIDPSETTLERVMEILLEGETANG